MNAKLTNESPVWNPNAPNGMYQNPIIFADYSDPDVICVNDDFYLISSSFASTPGIPVLHSRDLVNWAIIGHVFDNFPLAYYDPVRHGEGAWAPSLRFHDNYFWVFFGAPDHGIYMSKAKDPSGPWSPLHLVKEAKGWIDPCPFWDEDGNAYLIMAFAKSRAGVKSILKIAPMATDGTALLAEPKLVFDGTKNHPTIEGPKLYKRNGQYYIFAPAGGVTNGWQTVLRATNIYGPYEDRIVMDQGKTDINGPHQGSWVELASGESWFVHFQDCGPYGRITHLQPMHWEDGWPIIGRRKDNSTRGEPVTSWKKPSVPYKKEERLPATSDDFSEGRLGLQWQWEANHKKEWYTFADGCLQLAAVPFPPDSKGIVYYLPNVLCQKFPAPAFTATAKLQLISSSQAEKGGLVVLGQQYQFLSLQQTEGGMTLEHVSGEKDREEALISQHLLDRNTVYLRVTVQAGAKCSFSYAEEDGTYIALGEPFQAKKGHWVGAKIGLFCASSEATSSGFLKAEWIRFSCIDR